MLQGQRYPTYVEVLPASPKFHSVLLYDRSLSRQLRFLISPQHTMVNLRNFRKKNVKIVNSNFQVSPMQFCEDHSEEYSGNVKLKTLGYDLQKEQHFKISTPIGSHGSNFKNPKGSFLRNIRKKIQEKFENFRLRILGGVAF